MKKEAQKTGFKMYGKCSTDVEYEYRGVTYFVEYSNDDSYCCSPAWVQHKNEQARIDEEIEAESKPKKPHRYEDTAEYGFNLFWDYIETGEWKGK